MIPPKYFSCSGNLIGTWHGLKGKVPQTSNQTEASKLPATPHRQPRRSFPGAVGSFLNQAMETQTEENKKKSRAGTECPAKDVLLIILLCNKQDGPLPHHLLWSSLPSQLPRGSAHVLLHMQRLFRFTRKNMYITSQGWSHGLFWVLQAWQLNTLCSKGFCPCTQAGFPRNPLTSECGALPSPHAASAQETFQHPAALVTVTCSHQETNAPGKLFGLYSDFRRKWMWPHGPSRFYKQKGLDFPSSFAFHWQDS